MAQPKDITLLLHEWRSGNREAENQLFALVLPKLKAIARRLMNGERQGHSLDASELVDQIYARLTSAKDRDWQNRQHFFAIAARAMRRHLIDHARSSPKINFVGLDGLEESLSAKNSQADLAIAIDRLLDEMATTKPEWCQIVELKFFLGLSNEEAAETLGLTVRTLLRRWRDARQWLFERLESAHGSQP